MRCDPLYLLWHQNEAQAHERAILFKSESTGLFCVREGILSDAEPSAV
jgi:hypothetical protein